MRIKEYISQFIFECSLLTVKSNCQPRPNPHREDSTPHSPDNSLLPELILTYPLVHPYDCTSDCDDIPSGNGSKSVHDPANSDDSTETPSLEDPSLSEADLYKLLAEAQANLVKTGHLNRRGAIPGVKGTYAATKVNGQPSRTTEWRRRKSTCVAKDFITEADKRHNLSRSPVLLKHFFNQQQRRQDTQEVFESGDSDTRDDIVLCWALVPDSDTEVDELEFEDDVYDSEDNLDGEVVQKTSPKGEICPMLPVSTAPGENHVCLPQATTRVVNPHSRPYIPPPTEQTAIEALHKLTQILHPRRRTGTGYKDPRLSVYTKAHIEQMLMLLRVFTERGGACRGQWLEGSESVARALGKKNSYGRRLRKWCRVFIRDFESVPKSSYGRRLSIILTDEDLKTELMEYLQSKGKYVSAQDVVDCTSQPGMMQCLRRQKPISIHTARRWMKLMGYRWRKEPKGQYADGHEREDVVAHRQKVFLPFMEECERRTRQWDRDGKQVTDVTQAGTSHRRLVIWFHDECIFYAHDRRILRWVHSSETAKPYAKGEGQSLMIADFVSADYGWLSSADGIESARVELKPGKNRDGYFSNDELLAQVRKAIHLARKLFPGDDHVFVFDNARSHAKRAEDALSARHLPKGTSKPGANWMLKVKKRSDDGKIVYDSSGKPAEVRIPMRSARFSDGRPQPLYFPQDHPTHPGLFKGMAVILEERGYVGARRLRAECAGFKCQKDSSGEYGPCCCRRILFNEPDFAIVPSLLSTLCNENGIPAMFLPKFSPELNPIEQCWGYAKRIYREFPPSSALDDVVKNAQKALASIPLECIRK